MAATAMTVKRTTKKAPAKAGANQTAPGKDRFITRHKVRDGIIVSEEISFDPNSKISSFADLKDSLEELFPSAEKIIRDLAAYAQEEIDKGATGTRKQYAEHAIQISGHVLEAIRKKKADSAVLLAIAMMQSIFRVQIKAIEPTVVTGAKASQQRRQAGISNKRERAEERKPTWQAWKLRARELHKQNPRRSWSHVCDQVGKEHGVTGRAVRKRVQKFGTERQRSKS